MDDAPTADRTRALTSGLGWKAVRLTAGNNSHTKTLQQTPRPIAQESIGVCDGGCADRARPAASGHDGSKHVGGDHTPSSELEPLYFHPAFVFSNLLSSHRWDDLPARDRES